MLPSLNLHRLFEKGNGDSQIVTAGLPDPVDQLKGLLTQPGNTPGAVLPDERHQCR